MYGLSIISNSLRLLWVFTLNTLNCFMMQLIIFLHSIHYTWSEYYIVYFIYQYTILLIRYEGQRDMLYNQTFNLDQVQFAAEGIKDAQQTVCIQELSFLCVPCIDWTLFIDPSVWHLYLYQPLKMVLFIKKAYFIIFSLLIQIKGFMA